MPGVNPSERACGVTAPHVGRGADERPFPRPPRHHRRCVVCIVIDRAGDFGDTEIEDFDRAVVQAGADEVRRFIVAGLSSFRNPYGGREPNVDELPRARSGRSERRERGRLQHSRGERRDDEAPVNSAAAPIVARKQSQMISCRSEERRGSHAAFRL
jgi:hypothetical protein